MSKTDRFHIPGRPDLKHVIGAHYGDTSIALSDAQIIALILNEICALRGRGFLHWLPSDTNNVEGPDRHVEMTRADIETLDEPPCTHDLLRQTVD